MADPVYEGRLRDVTITCRHCGATVKFKTSESLMRVPAELPASKTEWCDTTHPGHEFPKKLADGSVQTVAGGHHWRPRPGAEMEVDTRAWDTDEDGGPVCMACGDAPCIHCDHRWYWRKCVWDQNLLDV